MIESDKKLKELQRKLLSDNSRTISSAITLLRNEDPYKGALSLLIELFDRTADVSVKELVRNFLNDLKEPAVRGEIVAELLEKHKPDTKSMIASSCWQSGLDYSGFVMDFSKIFVEGDYLVALECFTVLEESIPYIDPEIKKQLILFLESQKGKLNVEKDKLNETLLSILS
jgi:hypothetical protein